ncbi:MAG TPA: hypothetical protein PK648_05310 [Verrucomicrobiales bacterium]|jgi:magnesium-transporting ATPase (P-type)|nr:hypothetical protein [Verrucomicrobiales bacterium]
MKKLRAEGEHVAMADDGINDALGLSEAEARIAMGIPIVAGRSLPFLWNPAQPHHSRCRDEHEFRLRYHKRTETAESEAVISRFNPHHENHPSL